MKKTIPQKEAAQTVTPPLSIRVLISVAAYLDAVVRGIQPSGTYWNMVTMPQFFAQRRRRYYQL